MTDENVNDLVRSYMRERDGWKARAEKAEAERDSARATADRIAEQATMAERARVVAWLRDEWFFDDGAHEDDNFRILPDAGEAAANAIERGEHVKGGE